MKSQSKAEKKAAGTSHTSSRADGRSVTWSDEDLRQEGPSRWQVQRALASLLSKVRSEVINVHLVYELSHACDHTHTHTHTHTASNQNKASQTPNTRRHGPGCRIHRSVEDTKLSTSKQHTLSITPLHMRDDKTITPHRMQHNYRREGLRCSAGAVYGAVLSRCTISQVHPAERVTVPTRLEKGESSRSLGKGCIFEEVCWLTGNMVDKLDEAQLDHWREELQDALHTVDHWRAAQEEVALMKECADFICPISLRLMHDPVITVDGRSFERMRIEQWFASLRGRAQWGSLRRQGAGCIVGDSGNGRQPA